MTKMPRSAYIRTIALIRDYPRLKEIVADICEASPSSGQSGNSPVQSSVSSMSSTESNAIRITPYMRDIRLIDTALKNSVPVPARKGVMDRIIYNTPYPDKYPVEKYLEYSNNFIYAVAKAANIVIGDAN